MAHQEQKTFCERIKARFPWFFEGVFALDIGSLDVNGNNHYLFSGATIYLGIDVAHGCNVDIISPAHELALPDSTFDVVVSTECLEHDMFWAKTLQNAARLLRPGGLLLITCATTGRPEHGTQRTSPQDAPLLAERGDEWGAYYRNLTEDDFRTAINISDCFQLAEFSIGEPTHDLYFIGIKHGVFELRTDRSGCLATHPARRREEALSDALSSAQNEVLTRCGELAQAHASQAKLVELLAEASTRSSGFAATVADLQRDATERDHEMASRLSSAQSEVSGSRLELLALQRSQAKLVELLAEANARFSGLTATIADLQRDAAERNHEMASRDGKTLRDAHKISSLERAVDENLDTIAKLHAEIAEAQYLSKQKIEELEKRLRRMASSYSWRLARPLREIGRWFRRLGRPTEFLKPIRKMTRPVRYFLMGKELPRQPRFAPRCDEGGAPILAEAGAAGHTESLAPPSPPKKWGIMSTPHTLYIARLIADRLKSHGWQADVLTGTPPKFEHEMYVVICPQMFEPLPPGEKRIVYQMEQSVSERWFTKEYLQILECSLAVMDYSLVNLEFLARRGIAYPHVYYLPVGALSDYSASTGPEEKRYDVLFYGDAQSSERRLRMLAALRKAFAVHVCSEVFAEDIIREIKRARVVVNIHYYEDSLLEMPRIQECLSLGVPVVSESSRDQCDYPEIADAVNFFPLGDEHAMIAAVQSALESPPAQDRIKNCVQRSAGRFAFMLDRFLAGMKFLPVRETGDLQPPLPLGSSQIALSLPETVARRRAYESNKPPGFVTFDGIRAKPGWIGCGLSYAILARYALANNIFRLTVIEDDVVLPPDFKEKMEIVNAYLDRRGDQWDVFAGIIANVNKDCRVLGVEEFCGIRFATIDKMTSTVCNIYNRSVLALLGRWNPEVLDDQTNTIDRYLESQKGLRIVVALPFLVGHCEEMHSTLWGFQNTRYRDMIARSERDIMDRVHRTLSGRDPSFLGQRPRDEGQAAASAKERG